MSTTSTLSRRTLVASAAALPALAVPVVAGAAPMPAVGPITLPPDLIERFVRVREWYLDYNRREKLWSAEVDRRLFAATGVTREQYHSMNYKQRRANELNEAHSRACDEVQLEEKCETECDDLGDERWDVAKAMMAHTPRTTADLAYQVEAFLVADLEMTCGDEPTNGGDWLVRMLLQNIRTLGALPLPEDSFGSLRTRVAFGRCPSSARTSASVIISMTVGIVSDRGNRADQFGRDMRVVAIVRRTLTGRLSGELQIR
jgi:hypothetical protein